MSISVEILFADWEKMLCLCLCFFPVQLQAGLKRVSTEAGTCTWQVIKWATGCVYPCAPWSPPSRPDGKEQVVPEIKKCKLVLFKPDKYKVDNIYNVVQVFNCGGAAVLKRCKLDWSLPDKPPTSRCLLFCYKVFTDQEPPAPRLT